MVLLQRLIKMKKITEIHCSQLARPMNCPGFLFFEDLPKSETNQAAKEGTAIGEHIANILTLKPLTTHASNGIEIDDDMKFYAKQTVEEIIPRAQSEILCETKVKWVTRSGIVIQGSSDICYTLDDNKILCIDDFKYGWNIVNVRENWQLLGYAIGEVIRRQQAFDHIILRILQPRPHHEDGTIREWKISYDQLLEYKEQIEKRMDQIAAGFAQLVTGSQCKYCPAAASACTAFNRAVFHGVDYILDHFQQDQINEKEISFQLDMLDRIGEILKIKSDSLNQLAMNKIKEGALIPNYSMEQRFGDRKWKSNINAKVLEILTGRKVTEEVMLSPAKCEKLGISKDLINTYVDRFFVGNKIVRKDGNTLGDKIFGTKQQ